VRRLDGLLSARLYAVHSFLQGLLRLDGKVVEVHIVISFLLFILLLCVMSILQPHHAREASNSLPSGERRGGKRKYADKKAESGWK
jgi:hypothetical protein